jgi:GntR family transcriptional regulator
MEFRIDPGNRQPIYRQLAGQIRAAIATGKLACDDRLPSVRELSRELVINPNTVARVYTELEREGLLNTRPGLGVFVARAKVELTKKARRDRLQGAIDQFLTEAVHLGFSADEVIDLVRDRSGRFHWDGGP